MITIIERYDLSKPQTISVLSYKENKDKTVWDFIPEHVRNSDVTVQVVLNNTDIDDESLKTTKVKDGDRLALRIIPGAAGGLLLGVLATVIVTTVIGTAIQVILNRLQGRPRRPRSDDETNFFFDIPQITTANGQPSSLVFGKTRTSGHLLTAEVVSDASGSNRLTVLIGLGDSGNKGFKSIGGFTSDVDRSSDLQDKLGKIFINDNPVTNFEGVKISTRLGSNFQRAIEPFADKTVVSSTAFNQEVAFLNAGLIATNSPFIYTTSSSTVERVVIAITYDFLFEDDPIDFRGNAIDSVFVEHKPVTEPDWTNATTFLVPVVRFTQVPFSVDVEIDNPNKTQLDIRLRSDLIKFIDDAGFFGVPFNINFRWRVTGVQEIVFDRFTYPGKALVAIEAIATGQLHGGSFNASFVCEGIQPRVYTTTSVFTEIFTQNPAWVILFLLTDVESGLGNLIDITHVDIQSFIDTAAYADELVDDGNGGTEKRYEVNFTLDQKRPAWEWIIDIARSSQISIFYHGGIYILKPDRDVSPVMQHNPGNMRDLEVSYTEKRQRVNFLELSYRDEARDYKDDFINSIDKSIKGDISKFVKDSELLVGTTRRSQALRIGNLRIRENVNLRRVARFKTDILSIRYEPFDVIELADSEVQWGVHNGVVASGSTTSNIKLDREGALSAGPYSIRIFFSNGTFEQRDTLQVNTVTREIITTTAFTQAPSAGDFYSIGTVNNVIREMRVVEVVREDDMTASVLCVEYNDAVYDDTIEDIGPFLPRVDTRFTDIPPDVVNVSAVEQSSAGSDGSINTIIYVYFEPPVSEIYHHVDVFIGFAAGALINPSDTTIVWERIPAATSVNSPAIINRILSIGRAFTFAVVSANVLGQGKHPSLAPSATLTITGKATAPATVQNFRAGVFEDVLIFTWDANTETDVELYELRAGTAWESSIPFAFTAGTKFELSIFHTTNNAVNRGFFIKAKNTTGVYSTVAANITVSIPPRAGRISTLVTQFHPSWIGTRTNMTISGVDLVLDSGQISGEYETLSQDIGAVSTRKVTANVLASLIDPASTWASSTFTWDSTEAQNTAWQGAANANNATIKIFWRFANDTTALAAATYTEFVPQTQTFRYSQFKVTVSVSDTTFGFQFDQFEIATEGFPIINQGEELLDFGTSAVVKTVTYDTSFVEAGTVVLQVTLLDLNIDADDYVEITNRITTGFDVVVRDEFDNIVTTDRRISYSARGV